MTVARNADEPIRATYLTICFWHAGAVFARFPLRALVIGFALALSHAVALGALSQAALPQLTGAVVADGAQHRLRVLG